MGNFSRNTFDPAKRYTAVRLQQGVPLVDAVGTGILVWQSRVCDPVELVGELRLGDACRPRKPKRCDDVRV